MTSGARQVSDCRYVSFFTLRSLTCFRVEDQRPEAAAASWPASQRLDAQVSCLAPGAFLFLFVQLRQLFPQVFYFGNVVDNNVGLVRMLGQVILMITLSIMERFQGRHLSDD